MHDQDNAVAMLQQHVATEVGKAVVGQPELLSQCTVALLCRGHVLLEGVPGLAKTLVVKVLARLLQLDYQRVQATPDLMPADILGGNVANLANGTFSLRRGPIFTDLLLVDEINRMPPRTQAALLEAMEERQITIEGELHTLRDDFLVFATQNPVEFEGTYPLPEAQLDRFLLKIRVGYPERAAEEAMLAQYQHGENAHDLGRLGLVPLAAALLAAARQQVNAVRVEPQLVSYVAAVVRRTREWPILMLGASPRAALSLLHVAKAMAACEGRDYLLPDDVKAAALPVLRHRLVLKPEADLEGVSADQAITEVLAAVEVPR